MSATGPFPREFFTLCVAGWFWTVFAAAWASVKDVNGFGNWSRELFVYCERVSPVALLTVERRFRSYLTVVDTVLSILNVSVRRITVHVLDCGNLELRIRGNLPKLRRSVSHPDKLSSRSKMRESEWKGVVRLVFED